MRDAVVVWVFGRESVAFEEKEGLMATVCEADMGIVGDTLAAAVTVVDGVSVSDSVAESVAKGTREAVGDAVGVWVFGRESVAFDEAVGLTTMDSEGVGTRDDDALIAAVPVFERVFVSGSEGVGVATGPWEAVRDVVGVGVRGWESVVFGETVGLMAAVSEGVCASVEEALTAAVPVPDGVSVSG